MADVLLQRSADVGDLEPVKAPERACRALHSDAYGVVDSLLGGTNDLGQAVHMTVHGFFSSGRGLVRP